MAEDVILPKTGLNTDDIEFLEWLCEEGAPVAAGDLVLRMETNKVEVEVEAEAAGFLHRIVEPPATLPVGAKVGVIAETREEYEQLAAG